MFASTLGSGHRDGLIRVVPEADEIVAVCLEGEFDMANAQELADRIDRTLESGRDLVLDLSEATFIDSCVINIVVAAARKAVDTERTIVLQLGTAAVVERVLEIAGIERVLTRAHDRREAVRLIRSKEAV